MNFGWAMERVRRVSCDTPNPNLLRFCDHTGELYQELGAVPDIPYRHEYKFSMAQELPYQFNVGASFISFSGANRLVGAAGGANVVGTGGSVAWPVPAAQFPGGITEAVTVPLLAPGISYLDRWNQLDLSVRRSFKVGQRFELRPALELYNVTNGAVVLSRNNNFGPALDAPLSVLQGRFTKLSVLVKF